MTSWGPARSYNVLETSQCLASVPVATRAHAGSQWANILLWGTSNESIQVLCHGNVFGGCVLELKECDIIWPCEISHLTYIPALYLLHCQRSERNPQMHTNLWSVPFVCDGTSIFHLLLEFSHCIAQVEDQRVPTCFWDLPRRKVHVHDIAQEDQAIEAQEHHICHDIHVSPSCRYILLQKSLLHKPQHLNLPLPLAFSPPRLAEVREALKGVHWLRGCIGRRCGYFGWSIASGSPGCLCVWGGIQLNHCWSMPFQVLKCIHRFLLFHSNLLLLSGKNTGGHLPRRNFLSKKASVTNISDDGWNRLSCNESS